MATANLYNCVHLILLHAEYVCTICVHLESIAYHSLTLIIVMLLLLSIPVDAAYSRIDYHGNMCVYTCMLCSEGGNTLPLRLHYAYIRLSYPCEAYDDFELVRTERFGQ